MSAAGSAAERDVVRKLARGSLFSRLKRSKQPLKLVAVPRDHVPGDRQRGEALIAGRMSVGKDSVALGDLDFARLGTHGALADLAGCADRRAETGSVGTGARRTGTP